MPIAVYRGSESYPFGETGSVVTIGNFDGVHLGHQALLQRAMAVADSVDVPACAFTFDPAPRDVLRPENDVPRIQSLDDRIAGLERVGVPHVVVEPFTLDYAKHDASWFASQVLATRLGARGVVVGWDFRFGRGRQGSLDELREAIEGPVEQLKPVLLGGEPISSSRIRMSVRAGEVASASTLLGRPHEVIGEIVSGDRRGRTLGFPTANVAAMTALTPAFGVYAVRMSLGGGPAIPGVCNLGRRPTFDEGRVQLEVHLLDWQGDCYGQHARVQFVRRLRGEQVFAGPDELKSQIRLDVMAARAALQ